jgi:Double zinc ribbon
MQCPRCGKQLPDDSQFCNGCGLPLGGGTRAGSASTGSYGYGGAGGSPSGPMPLPPPIPAAPTPPKDLKCPSCGAPLDPEFGDAVVTCAYCGATVSLIGTGWKSVTQHTMLTPQVLDAGAALKSVKASMDTGFFHGHRFEESKITEQKFAFVPYWIVPTSATTNMTYQDVAVSAGSTVATMAASAFIGNAIGGGRGNTFIPIMGGPVVNSKRQDQITGSYQFPVVAVKGYMQYQPKNYQFNLETRQVYKKDALPGGAAVLNGDLGEDFAQHEARAYVMQIQAESAHKKHYMVSSLQTDVEVGEAELLHAPIWRFGLEFKEHPIVLLVDANANRVMQSSF